MKSILVNGYAWFAALFAGILIGAIGALSAPLVAIEISEPLYHAVIGGLLMLALAMLLAVSYCGLVIRRYDPS
jgi:hypothetical protein